MTHSRTHAAFVTWGTGGDETEGRYVVYCGLELQGCPLEPTRYHVLEDAMTAAEGHCFTEEVEEGLPDPFGREAMPWEMDIGWPDYAAGEHLKL